MGRLLVHDAWRQEWSTIRVAADPDCVVCGPLADPRRALGIDEAPPLAGGAGAPTEVALPSVSAVDLAARLRAREAGADDFVLLDVREPGERDVVVIPGALAVPLAEVRARGREAVASAAADGIPVLVHCKTGGRSAEAVTILRAAGVDAVDVTGGVLAWVRDVDPSQPTY